MSIKVMSRVWEESPSKGSDLLLLLAIADFADDAGVAWPKTETLAHKVRMSERQVQRILRNLADSGQLIIHKNAGPRGTNKYQICHPRQDVTPDIAMSPHPDMDVTPTPDIAMSPEPSLEPSKEPSFLRVVPKEQNNDPESEPTSHQKAVTLVDAWANHVNGGVWPTAKGKALSQAKLLVEAGYTPADVVAILDWLREDDFWKDRPLGFGVLLSKADDWRIATKPGDDRELTQDELLAIDNFMDWVNAGHYEHGYEGMQRWRTDRANRTLPQIRRKP